MKILIAHNRYQHAGGEDAVVKTEYELLTTFGETVRLYERTNDEIDAWSLLKKLRVALSLGWSKSTYREFRKILQELKPDVVHFHNIFFMITPSAYQACRDENIPVVHSQHNFRLLCSNGLFFRDNHVCEECTTSSLWRGVRYGCYKKSRLMTALIVKLIDDHWKKGTWNSMVDLFLTATEFGKKKLTAGGIPQEKIIVKPNFLYPDPGERVKDEGYALYAGRLSHEKGIQTLVQSWGEMDTWPLKVMGDGPLMEELRALAQKNNLRSIEFLGFQSKEKAAQLMRGARFIIVPSVCYESFPRIIAEAYAYGIPILASRLGTMLDIVIDKETGILFEAGNPKDLAQKARWMFSHDKELKRMGQQARKEYEQRYSAKMNYQMLMDIYQKALARGKVKGP